MPQLELSRPISTGALYPQHFDHTDFAMYRKVVRRHPTMDWARRLSLENDLEQLGLLEVLKVLQTYDPTFGTSPVQYVSVAMRTRMYSCLRTLQSAYCDKRVPATSATKLKCAVDSGADIAALDKDVTDDRVADVLNPIGEASLSFAPAYLSVTANDESDRFTSCDEGEYFRPEPNDEDLIDSVLMGVEVTDQARKLLFAMDQLPCRQREIVDLVLHDYTDQEIAATLQVTVQAVHKTKQKAICALKTMMAGYMH